MEKGMIKMNRDVVIIGSGIAGMSAAIYLKRAGINCLIIEKDVVGGQLNKTNNIQNFPGFVSISGPDLAMNLYNQVNNLGVSYLFEEVINIKKEKDNIIIETINSNINAKYLIIATGRSPRKLKLRDEENLIGKGLSYCALCDGTLYKDKDVLVVGGGNSAIEDAIYLSNIAKSVTLIHRNSNLRAEKKSIDELEKNKNINILLNEELKDYELDKNKIKKVILKSGKEINVDGIFIAIGYERLYSMLDLDNENNYIIVDNKMHTSISSIYAVGDAIKKDIYQLITAANEGVVAAVDIIKHENK